MCGGWRVRDGERRGWSWFFRQECSSTWSTVYTLSTPCCPSATLRWRVLRADTCEEEAERGGRYGSGMHSTTVGQNTALLQPVRRSPSPNLGGMSTLRTDASGMYVHPGRAVAVQDGGPVTVPRLPLGSSAQVQSSSLEPPLPRQAEQEDSYDAEVAAVNTPTGSTPRHTIVGPTAFIPTPSPTRQFMEGTAQVAGSKTTPRSWSSKLILVETPFEHDVGRQLRDQAKAGKTAECAKMLADGASPDAFDERYCNTPLMWASMRGFAETVELLLAKGANSELQNSDGWTALVAAVWYGHAGVCRALLQHGASPHVTAANEVPMAVVAAMQGNRQVLKLLLDHGVALEGTGTDGMTALLMACEYGRADVVQELLNRGANGNASCARGFNARQYADAGAYKSISMKLREYHHISTKVSEGRHSSLEHWA